MNKSYIADQIKRRISAIEIFSAYGIQIDKKGFASCPFHNEKTPSLKAYNGDKGFYCFGCGKNGDVISFVQEYFSLSFSDAVSKINADFSLSLPIGERIDKRRQTDIARQAFFRNQEQKKKKQEHEKLFIAWLDAQSELMRLEKQKVKYKPKCVCDELHPKFVEALHNIEYTKYKVGCAWEDLYYYEQTNS